MLLFIGPLCYTTATLSQGRYEYIRRLRYDASSYEQCRCSKCNVWQGPWSSHFRPGPARPGSPTVACQNTVYILKTMSPPANVLANFRFLFWGDFLPMCPVLLSRVKCITAKLSLTRNILDCDQSNVPLAHLLHTDRRQDLGDNISRDIANFLLTFRCHGNHARSC